MEDTFFICGCIISLKPKLYSICFPKLHLFIVTLISDVSRCPCETASCLSPYLVAWSVSHFIFCVATFFFFLSIFTENNYCKRKSYVPTIKGEPVSHAIGKSNYKNNINKNKTAVSWSLARIRSLSSHFSIKEQT